jgi:hypothetical protein
MRDLADAGATAVFEVEALDRDPFLWVRDGAERYCIAVWDERGFIR